MHTYKISLPNIRYGHLMPPEDSMDVQGNIFAVGDGITRDPLVPDGVLPASTEEALAYYPNPSGARFASDTFTREFISFMSKREPNQSSVYAAFIDANRKIRELNQEHNPVVDYLVNDYWACVGVGAVLDPANKLHWGLVCDCGLIIYDKDGTVRFQTPNLMKPFEDAVASKMVKFEWRTPEGRKIVRSNYRNRLEMKVDDECVSYGAMTGEEALADFIRCGSVQLEAGDLAILYTDGCEHVVTHPDFFKTVYSVQDGVFEQEFVPFAQSLAIEDYEKYGKEKTLVAFVIL